jgi:hypothetical protein
MCQLEDWRTALGSIVPPDSSVTMSIFSAFLVYHSAAVLGLLTWLEIDQISFNKHVELFEDLLDDAQAAVNASLHGLNTLDDDLLRDIM